MSSTDTTVIAPPADEPPKARWSPKKLAILGVKLAITAVLIWFVTRQVSIEQILTQFARFDVAYLIPIGLIFLGHIYFSGVRWGILSRHYGDRMNTGQLVAKSAIAYFLNQIVLGTIGGDAYRIYAMRQAGYTLFEAIAVILIERLMIMLVLAVIVIMTFPALAAIAGEPLFNVGAVLGALGMAGGLAFALWLGTRERVPTHGLFRILAILQSLCGFMVVGVKSLSSILITIGIFATSIVIFWLAALGLGFSPPFWLYLVAVPAAVLVSMLPISVGGWGARELTFATLVAYLGGSFQESVVVSAAVGVLMMLVSIPGLVFVGLELRGGAGLGSAPATK